MAEVLHAVVSVTSPLKIRFDGSSTDTPVDKKATAAAALTFALNDEVMYTILEGKVIVIDRYS